MTVSDRECKFSKVYDEEIKEEIIPRRLAACINDQDTTEAAVVAATETASSKPQTEEEKHEQRVRESLVGVAISGGGIRAASFGLGVLQALFRNKLMRRVDYLSTVSGGGYCGSLFSSLVNHPEGIVAWRDSQVPKPQQPAAKCGKQDPKPAATPAQTPEESSYSIESGEGGKQPPLVRSLSTSGPVLRRPVWFACSYFFGLLLTNLVAVSGLLAAGAFFAYLFQELNEPSVATFVGALGFNDDVKLAFFPAFVLTLLWAFCMLVGNAVQSLEFLMSLARGLFVMLVASLAMGIVALIGSGNIDISSITKTVGVSTDTTLVASLGGGRVLSVIVLIIALVPYLRVKDLVRSGVRPKDFKERWVFAIASRALLYGVPLLIFGYFVGENFSGFNDDREIRVDDRQFSNSSLLYPSYFGREWPQFWQTVETSAKSKAVGASASKRSATSASGVLGNKSSSLQDDIDRVLWQIANANGPAAHNGIDPISTARSLDSWFWPSTLATPIQNRQWSWPTNDDDHHEAADEQGLQVRIKGVESPKEGTSVTRAAGARLEAATTDQLSLMEGSVVTDDVSLGVQPSIIDMEQDLQTGLEEYDNCYLVEKWSLLPSLLWPQGNPLAIFVDRKIRGACRDGAICDRINYQFLSNPLVAAALVDKLEKEGTVGDAEAKDDHSRSQLQPSRDIIATLDRSPGGAVVRRFIASEGANRVNRLLGVVKEFAESDENEDKFLRMFLEWQYFKHRILYLERTGWSEVTEAEKKNLIHQLDERLISDKESTHRQRDFEAMEAGIREFNLACLDKLFYPKRLQPQDTIFSSVVLPHDQRARLKFFGWAALTCLIASIVVNLNFTSIHSYYQQMMAKVWIVDRPGDANRLPLVQLNNTSVGAPYHLLHGTVSLTPRGRFKPDFPRGGFLFSKRYCGGVDRGYVKTSELINVDLATAMSVSGAAITPSAVDNQLVWAIMFVCNLRTGQWLAWPSAVTTRLTNVLYRVAQWRPGIAWHVFLNACLPPAWRTMTFVYDGGLYENLGVEPLLARRCRLILAVDAAEDGNSRFADFQLLVQRCRSRYGVVIEEIKPQGQENNADVWMARVSPKWVKAYSDPQKRTFDERLAEHGVMFFRITYPSHSGLELKPLSADKREGTLVYIKPTLTKDARPDVLGYAQGETEFPQDETLNQFYQPRQFDAYRSLGESLGEEALKELEARTGQLPGVTPDWKPLKQVGPDAPQADQAEEEVAKRADHWLDEAILNALKSKDADKVARYVLLAVASALHIPRNESRYLPIVEVAINNSVKLEPKECAKFVRRALAEYIRQADHGKRAN